MRENTHAAEFQADPFNLIEDVVARQNDLTLTGVKLMARWGKGEMTVQSAQVVKKPHHRRLIYFPWQKHLFQELIMDDKYIYHFNPSRNIAFRSPLATEGSDDETILNLAEKNYTWIDEGQEMVAGQFSRRIAAVSKADSKTVKRFWVDPGHKAILREERYDEEENLIFFAGYLNVSFPKELPDTFFDIRYPGKIRDVPPPKQLEGENALKALDFQPLPPQTVPPGFLLVGTYLTQWPSSQKLQFRYTDGLRNFSVYESRRNGPYHFLQGSRKVRSQQGRSFELLKTSDGNVIRFQHGSLTIAVIGNIPLRMAENIADGIGTQPSLSSIQPLDYYFHRGLSIAKRFLGIIITHLTHLFFSFPSA